MSHLFTPLTLRSIELKNRIVVSPMCQYSSEDGFINDWHLVHLGSRAIGGAALVFTEATAVSPEGRITPDDLGIWKDEHIEGLKRIATFIEAHGSVPGIQLAHAGRKASHSSPWKGNALIPVSEGGWQTVAPSAIPFSDTYAVPAEMTTTQIKQLIHDFQAAAVRALEAGFKVVEIHAAHGYLINEFLTPLNNQRTDNYGGSFENRCRLLLQIIAAVQEVWPADLPLFVRISASDWVDGGWTIEDSVALARILKDKGVDVIDCSSGGTSPDAKIAVGPGYQVPFAERIRKETGIKTGAVGIIVSASQSEAILESGQADLIFMAREFLRDPYFPMHAAREQGVDIEWPDQYVRAKRK